MSEEPEVRESRHDEYNGRHDSNALTLLAISTAFLAAIMLIADVPDILVNGDVNKNQNQNPLNVAAALLAVAAYRTARLLLAIATALTLTVLIACSGDEPPPTDRPDRSQPQLEKTIEALDAEITALQTETATLRHASQTSDPAITTPPAVKTNEDIRTPITAPPHMAVPSSTGPGICGRSPQAQQAILRWLRTSSCRTVTEAELYRLSSKQADIWFDSASQEGDFRRPATGLR